MRTISLNSQYIVLFKNPRDNSQFAHLARQIYPHNYLYGIEAYKNNTQDAIGYLLIDLHNEQNEELRLRTRTYFPANDRLFTCRNESSHPLVYDHTEKHYSHG